jgi:diguanylate cyclase
MALRETDIHTGLYTPGFFIAFGARELIFARNSGHPLSVISVGVESPIQRANMTDLMSEMLALRELGQEIRKVVGKDTIVAKVGEDELAVLLPRTTQEEALDIAEQIKAALASEEIIPEDAIECTNYLPEAFRTISTGVASTKDYDLDFSDLLRASQDALEAERFAEHD